VPRIQKLQNYSAAQLSKQFAIFLETTDGRQFVVSLVLMVSNDVYRTVSHLKDVDRSCSWLNQEWEGIDSVIRSLPFMLICDGYNNRDRRQNGQIIQCPFIFTGLDAIDQSRWQSITTRIFPGLQAWTTLNGALEAVIQESPPMTQSIETPVAFSTIDIKTIDYDNFLTRDNDTDIDTADEQEDPGDLEDAWKTKLASRKESLVRANNATMERLQYTATDVERFKASNRGRLCLGYRDSTGRDADCPGSIELSWGNARVWDRSGQSLFVSKSAGMGAIMLTDVKHVYVLRVQNTSTKKI